MIAFPEPGLVGTFGFQLPTRIRFGPGTRRDVGPVAAAHGRRALLLTGASFHSNPGAPELLAGLAHAGVEVVERAVGGGEPDDGAVLQLVGRLTSAEADVIVAVGGGSVLDLAKAAALRPSRERLAELLLGERVERPDLPVVAVPTTAGSGAEVSHGAIVLDRAARRKRGVRGPGVAAREAVVDPELMASAPSSVVAGSGFDAIAHAVETAASRAASPMALDLAGIALRHLLDAVPRAAAAAPEARDVGPAAYAAMLMGINLANSTTCLPHRLQYPLGAATGTGHAVGVAALTPAWLRRTAAGAPAHLARLARRAGLADRSASDEAAAAALEAAILAHLDATGMRIRLRDLGVMARDVPRLVESVEGTLHNDPLPPSPDDVRDLYLASLEGG